MADKPKVVLQVKGVTCEPDLQKLKSALRAGLADQAPSTEIKVEGPRNDKVRVDIIGAEATLVAWYVKTVVDAFRECGAKQPEINATNIRVNGVGL